MLGSGGFLLCSPLLDLFFSFESVHFKLFLSFSLGSFLRSSQFIESLLAIQAFLLDLSLPFETSPFLLFTVGLNLGFSIQSVLFKSSLSFGDESLVVMTDGLGELLQREHSVGVVIATSEDGFKIFILRYKSINFKKPDKVHNFDIGFTAGNISKHFINFTSWYTCKSHSGLSSSREESSFAIENTSGH